MPFCRNCGNKLDDLSKFCENCGAACDMQNTPQPAPAPEPSYQQPHYQNVNSAPMNRGAELGRVTSNFPTVRAYIGRVIVCSITLPLIMIVLIAFFAVLADSSTADELFIAYVFFAFFLLLGIGDLMLLIFAGISISQYKKNYLCICENCLYGVAASTFSAKPFEIPYEAILNVSYVHTSLIVVNHYLSIRTASGEIRCSVENPENVAGFINQTINRKRQGVI